MNVKVVNVNQFSAATPTGMAGVMYLPKTDGELWTYEFKTGINFLPGTFFDGHWGIPYILTQKLFKFNYVDGGVMYHTKKSEMMLWAESLLMNDENIDFTKAYKNFFFVDMDVFNRRQMYKLTLDSIIKKECKKSGVEYKYVENIFSFQNSHFYERTVRSQQSPFYYVTAFGFAKGYKIFCCPWYRRGGLFPSLYLIKKLHGIALENDLTVIIPVEENLFVNSNVVEWRGQKEVFDFDYNVVKIEKN